MSGSRKVSTSQKDDVRKNRGCSAIAVLCGVAGFALLVWVFPRCDADSRQARMARSLSQERLASLHQAMSKLWEKIPKEERNTASVHLRGDQIPKEFDGLNAKLVRIRSERSIIRLQGCYDHHLDLIFSGVGEPSASGEHPPAIVLRSGEIDIKMETLWQPEPAGRTPESAK